MGGANQGGSLLGQGVPGNISERMVGTMDNWKCVGFPLKKCGKMKKGKWLLVMP